MPARKAHPAFIVEGLGIWRRACKAPDSMYRGTIRLEGSDRLYVDDPFGNRSRVDGAKEIIHL